MTEAQQRKRELDRIHRDTRIHSKNNTDYVPLPKLE